MGEPLKNKIVNISTDDTKTWVAYEEDIKSAVEYLKSFFTGGLKVLEEYALEKIDKAFPDLVFPNLQEKEGMTIKGSRTIRTDGIQSTDKQSNK